VLLVFSDFAPQKKKKKKKKKNRDKILSKKRKRVRVSPRILSQDFPQSCS